jgi:hypothetical protein
MLDVALDNSPTARPPFEIALLIILSVLWLGWLFPCGLLWISANNHPDSRQRFLIFPLETRST